MTKEEREKSIANEAPEIQKAMRRFWKRCDELAASQPRASLSALADALRSVNDLQHRMAIELNEIPQQPRVEFWTRQMEQVICDALATLAEPEGEK